MRTFPLLFKTGLIILLLIPFSLFSQNQQGTQQKNDTTTYDFSGKIISKTGNNIIVQQTDSNKLPGANTEGTLSKYFEKVFFGMNTKGWLDVGAMKIVSVENNIVTMLLLQEASVITVNGQKEDHFQPGFIVKFSWKEY